MSLFQQWKTVFQHHSKPVHVKPMKLLVVQTAFAAGARGILNELIPWLNGVPPTLAADKYVQRLIEQITKLDVEVTEMSNAMVRKTENLRDETKDGPPK